MKRVIIIMEDVQYTMQICSFVFTLTVIVWQLCSPLVSTPPNSGSSEDASHVTPVPLLPSTDPHRSFIGRLVAEILRITDPKLVRNFAAKPKIAPAGSCICDNPVMCFILCLIYGISINNKNLLINVYDMFTILDILTLNFVHIVSIY